MKIQNLLRYLSLFILIGILAACSQTKNEKTEQELAALTATAAQRALPSPIETSLPPTATATETQIPPTVTQTPTFTPTATFTETPTETATPSATPTQTANNSASVSNNSITNPIRIVLIAQNTGGSICGDTAVFLKTDIKRKGNMESNVMAALKRLLEIDSVYVGNLYNPLAKTGLKVANVKYSNGALVVQMRGAYKQPKDPCDNTRMKAQIWETIKQFDGITSLIIYHNDLLLGDKLSNDK